MTSAAVLIEEVPQAFSASGKRPCVMAEGQCPACAKGHQFGITCTSPMFLEQPMVCAESNASTLS